MKAPFIHLKALPCSLGNCGVHAHPNAPLITPPRPPTSGSVWLYLIRLGPPLHPGMCGGLGRLAMWEAVFGDPLGAETEAGQ